MLKFESIRHLENWLISKGINTAQWGTGVAKSIPDLWAEIMNGESQLEDHPPLRTVNVVSVIVRDGNKVLVEGEQQLGESQQRYRGLPLSEKIKPRESQLDAAIRGLSEELQIKPTDVKVLKASPQPQLILRISRSYPGLRTRYVVYTVEVEAGNLPGEDFWTHESQSDHDVAVKRHQWRWITSDP